MITFDEMQMSQYQNDITESTSKLFINQKSPILTADQKVAFVTYCHLNFKKEKI
jgi:hypothetical protein